MAKRKTEGERKEASRKAAYNARSWANRKKEPKLLNHLVATRLSKELDRDFRAMCKSMGRKYATQIRHLISGFTWGKEV